MPRAEADSSRHTGLVTAAFPLGPLLGQVQADIDQRMFPSGDVTQVNADLTVVDLAQPAAPLSLHADGLLALLGEGRGSKTSTPSSWPNSAPTWRTSSVSRGRWSHSVWPMNFCKPWRSRSCK